MEVAAMQAESQQIPLVASSIDSDLWEHVCKMMTVGEVGECDEDDPDTPGCVYDDMPEEDGSSMVNLAVSCKFLLFLLPLAHRTHTIWLDRPLFRYSACNDMDFELEFEDAEPNSSCVIYSGADDTWAVRELRTTTMRISRRYKRVPCKEVFYSLEDGCGSLARDFKQPQNVFKAPKLFLYYSNATVNDTIAQCSVCGKQSNNFSMWDVLKTDENNNVCDNTYTANACVCQECMTYEVDAPHDEVCHISYGNYLIAVKLRSWNPFVPDPTDSPFYDSDDDSDRSSNSGSSSNESDSEIAAAGPASVLWEIVDSGSDYEDN
jgi:hypothetical protein